MICYVDIWSNKFRKLFFFIFLTASKWPVMIPKHIPNMAKQFWKNMIFEKNWTICHHNISCLIISYDFISYLMIWYDIIWYDMASYDIIWYHTIWYHMIWYDIIWYTLEIWNFFRKMYLEKNTLTNQTYAKKIRAKILYIFHIETLQDFFSRVSFGYFRFLIHTYIHIHIYIYIYIITISYDIIW